MKHRALHNGWLLNTGVLLVALLLIAKLAYLQIAKGEYYQSKAESKYLVPVQSSFDRGAIYFTEKTGRRISAATVVSEYSLAIDPSKIIDGEALARKLSPIIEVNVKDFSNRAARENDQYELIIKKVSETQASAIRGLGEKGIILQKNQKRLYPGNRVASQVLGFVGDAPKAGESPSGRYGLEQYYNETLVRTGNSDSVSFFADLFLKPAEGILFDRGRSGDLITTIEPSVQSYLEQVLTDGIYKKYQASFASGIIMNPKTGEIYAMAAIPNFDPNGFSKERDVGVFANPSVSGVYEMGSIVKALTIAAGIDAGVITAYTTYDDKGSRIVNTKKIGNFDGKARGKVNMQEVLNQSLNTGTMFVVDKLGNEKFREYFKQFGLGEETGIDLPNEAVGDLRNLESPRDIEYRTASFGQGISMTPIGVLRALSSLANGGVMVTPHVVKRTEYRIGLPRDFVPTTERRVIKKETSAEISRMLTEVVDTSLMGGTLKMKHYSIAAKTGTAQIVEKGIYSETNFLHTFFGYFPSKDPQFIIFLTVKNPRGERYASHTLSVPFMQLTKYLLNYYEIPPDR